MSHGSAAVVSAANRVYLQECLQDAPLALWKLGEAGIGAAADSSGNSRPMTYQGGNVYSNPGPTVDGDKAISNTATAASNAFASIVSDTWMNTGAALSMECWLKTTATIDRGFFTRTGGGSSFQYQLTMNNGLAGFAVRTTGTGGGFTSFDGSITGLNDGAWHHFVGTWSGGLAVLYVDGVVSGSSARAGATISTGANALAIGGRASLTLPGTYAMAAIYGQALSPDRVLAHYQAAK